ncbi:MAG: DUF2325 domain-containing protein [Neorhizobium sp.]|nr:DUF2325 domain-containing protein [Neorhizobium sp.]
MSLLPSLPGLHQGKAVAQVSLATGRPQPAIGSPRANANGNRKSKGRLKTFEISSHYHCSIVGTCLTAGELRQVLVKGGDETARHASDHALHSRGVWLAGQQSVQSKLLTKALDRRHEGFIRQVARLSRPDELRAFWRAAFDRGDIGGAYWAVLSHPDTDDLLMRDIFGEVHMLSHLVGSASRLDIARLTRLEAVLDEQSALISRQERRLSEAAEERAALARDNDRLTIALARAQAEATAVNTSGASGAPGDGGHGADRTAGQGVTATAAPARSGDAGRIEIDRLTSRLAGACADIETLQQRAHRAEIQVAELRRENDLAERLLAASDPAASVIAGRDPATGGAPDPGQTACGCAQDGCCSAVGTGGAVLYVGGRRNLYDRLRAIAADHGVRLILHDGGMEDSTTLLPAVLAQAETVIFPVDHISHTATGIIKRICRESGKPYHPLRSAGLTSFVAALRAAREAVDPLRPQMA